MLTEGVSLWGGSRSSDQPARRLQPAFWVLLNRVINVTRVQPVKRVNVVTRIHDRTAVKNRTVNVAQTRVLPTRTIRTSKVEQFNYAPKMQQTMMKRSSF